MNVLEAIAAAKEGKVIRRPNWPEAAGMFWDGNDLVLEGTLAVTRNPSFRVEAVLANDWVAQ